MASLGLLRSDGFTVVESCGLLCCHMLSFLLAIPGLQFESRPAVCHQTPGLPLSFSAGV